ncbi:thermonuclease family protein [Nocardioides marmoribigeumensis]|uniref:Endonuclease YncB(Thermonuclease family) n=1 Tax=Nocardioides marmoribigeumensis TaxID=433649 RepID=A0ABU2C0H6_9ACTN|nr:thermonuclease family protein [Nocardioides marmoribigeumensis]MDR7364165.1 endonuclease YncB(thermonuclease family) [Nocardioides marmoribigeumensis]
MRRSLVLVVALVAGVLSTLAGAGPAAALDYDCSDFSTQAQAQKVYLDAGGPRSDPYRLDADDDGRACDSLPCPCGSSGGSTSGSTSGSTRPARLVQYGRVTKVVDGDTIDVRLHSGAQRRVRLVGIDTPEVYGGVECGGRAASRSLKRKLPTGTPVKLVSDPTQDRVDRYGRLLRYVVKRSTGRDMNRTQVWLGWATVYVYAGTPFERVTSYRRAQSDARSAPRGIWRAC